MSEAALSIFDWAYVNEKQWKIRLIGDADMRHFGA
jgi:hypothetical protein